MSQEPKPTAEGKGPSSVSIFLAAAPDPEKQGLGAVSPRVTHMSGGREIGVKLYTERLLVSRAIGKADQLGLRFIASLLLVEFFVQSQWSNSIEISAIRDALITQLGGPWRFNANWSFLSGELARNELTAGLEKTGVFPGAKTAAAPWFRLECDLPTTSTIWQWNPALNRKSNGDLTAASKCVADALYGLPPAHAPSEVTSASWPARADVR